jgi:hypothetical protein
MSHRRSGVLLGGGLADATLSVKCNFFHDFNYLILFVKDKTNKRAKVF